MARPVWKGSIAFGLVSIPVGLHVAIQERRVRFNQLERGTANRIRYRRVNEESGEEVPLDRIVRGVPLGEGRYVVLDDEELAAAAPEQSRTIELVDFVAGGEIDPMLFETPYFLAPASDAARRPYALLAAALERSGRVGIGSFVLREREHLAAIRSRGRLLVLETMRFVDELRAPPGELEGIEDLLVRERELDIALSLVESMESAWEPGRYRDSYRERLEALVEAKARGEQISVHAPSAPAPNVVDLVAVLSRSVEEARARRGIRARREDGLPATAGPASSSTPPAQSRGRRPAVPAAPSKEVPADVADLAALSRDELYRLAQAHGVQGRSSMGRAALAEAVEAAVRETRGRGRRRAS